MIADLSHYNGRIDWERARKELEFVIFRSSVGMKADNLYGKYSEECGLPYGVYHYVKAGTAEEAVKEADWFIACAQVGEPLFYIADIEYETQTKDTTDAVCLAFLRRLKARGCGRVGLYIGQSRYPWAAEALKMSDIVWVPRYGKNDGKVPGSQYLPKYPCHIWQYTSVGRVDGIEGNVDLNQLMGVDLDWLVNGVKFEEVEPMGANERRIRVRDEYRKFLGRNKYSQNLRSYCVTKYKDGKYYSDCSSSVSYAFREAGEGFGILNTVGMYQKIGKGFVEVPAVIVKGQVQNPEVLRIGDMLLYAGTDNSRPGCVGHVEMVGEIDGTKITLYGHGSGTPKKTEMTEKNRSRYNAKTSTKVGNKGLIKVVRFILDDDEGEPEKETEKPIERVKITVAKGTWNLHRGPGTEYASFAIMKGGAKLIVVEKMANGWYCVTDGKVTGYLSGKAVVV